MKSSMFIAGIILMVSTALAQQGSRLSVWVGRGLAINRIGDVWKLEYNTNVSASYRFLAGLSIVGYLDFNTFSFRGDEPPQSAGGYELNSLLCGVKVSATIPRSRLSPYFLGTIGLSRATSSQETMFTHHHGYLRVFNVPRGNTFTALGAAGSDIAIFGGFFAFAEVRASWGFDTDVYELLIMWRAGIGLDLL